MYFNLLILFFQYLFELNFLDFFLIGFIDKTYIIILINLLNIFIYSVYKFINIIFINIYFYFMQFYIIFISNTMFNKWSNILIIFFLKLEKNIFETCRYYSKKILKKRRWWKIYYRFYKISYLKFLFFILFFSIFILMWRRRNTYLKRNFIINLMFFYLLSIYIAFILVNIFNSIILGVLLSLFLSFLIIYIRLN